MRTAKLPPLLLVAAALAGACQEPLEAASEVTKLRILGVTADPPEVAPGGTTELRILTADPKGEGRRVVGGGIVLPGLFTPSSAPADAQLPPLYYELPFTEVNNGGVVAFPGALGIPSDYLEPNPDWDPDDPDSPENLEIPVAPPGAPLVMTAILVVCAGDGFDEAAASRAMGELFLRAMVAVDGALAFEEICAAAGAEAGVAALKTFDVVTCDPATSALSCDGEYEPNANPEIASLEIDGDAIDPHGEAVIECPADDGCREAIEIAGRLTADSFQYYERPLASNLDETELVYERTYISWFATGGLFEEERSGNGSTAAEPLPAEPFEVRWFPPAEGGDFAVWAVAHDLRGGVSWQTYSISARVGE